MPANKPDISPAQLSAAVDTALAVATLKRTAPHVDDSDAPPPEKKQRRSNKYTKKADRTNDTFTSIKCFLNSIVQSHPHAKAIVEVVDEMVLRSTRMCYVASLMVLHMVNRNFDESCRTRDWSFFVARDSEPFIIECFKAVTQSSHRLRSCVHDTRLPIADGRIWNCSGKYSSYEQCV